MLLIRNVEEKKICDEKGIQCRVNQTQNEQILFDESTCEGKHLEILIKKMMNHG